MNLLLKSQQTPAWKLKFGPMAVFRSEHQTDSSLLATQVASHKDCVRCGAKEDFVGLG